MSTVCPKCQGNPDLLSGCGLCGRTGVVSESFGYSALLDNFTYILNKEILDKSVEIKTKINQQSDDINYIRAKVDTIWNKVKDL